MGDLNDDDKTPSTIIQQQQQQQQDTAGGGGGGEDTILGRIPALVSTSTTDAADAPRPTLLSSPSQRPHSLNRLSSFSDQYRQQEAQLVRAFTRRNVTTTTAAAAAATTTSIIIIDPDDNSNHGGSVTSIGNVYENWQQLRCSCGRMVNNSHVQFLIVYLIATNAILMGIGTFDFVKNNPQVEQAFDVVDLVFLIVFSIELFMQFMFYGWKLILDGWLAFDLIIIVLSWAFAQVQIIRAFRIFRVFRLITRIKVLKNLVLALLSVVPRMFAIGVLLMLVSYIFAVMFTQLFKHLYEDGFTNEDYFGRLDATFFTLFQLSTLDNWADVCRQVTAVEGYGWAWIPFVVFVIATGFVVVNLIIAVICDAVSALHEDEKAKLHGTYDDSKRSEDGVDESMSVATEDIVDSQLDKLEHVVQELVETQRVNLEALKKLTSQIQQTTEAGIA